MGRRADPRPHRGGRLRADQDAPSETRPPITTWFWSTPEHPPAARTSPRASSRNWGPCSFTAWPSGPAIRSSSVLVTGPRAGGRGHTPIIGVPGLSGVVRADQRDLRGTAAVPLARVAAAAEAHAAGDHHPQGPLPHGRRRMGAGDRRTGGRPHRRRSALPGSRRDHLARPRGRHRPHPPLPGGRGSRAGSHGGALPRRAGDRPHHRPHRQPRSVPGPAGPIPGRGRPPVLERQRRQPRRAAGRGAWRRAPRRLAPSRSRRPANTTSPTCRSTCPASPWCCEFVHREQGLIIAPGNPKGITGLADLARDDVRYVNRQRGAGTRVLLDYHLEQLGIAPERVQGYAREEYTHLAVAVAIQSGAADCGLGIAAAAHALDLDFIPLAKERYDLVIPRVHYESELLRPLLDLVRGPELRQAVDGAGGIRHQPDGRVSDGVRLIQAGRRPPVRAASESVQRDRGRLQPGRPVRHVAETGSHLDQGA